MTPILGNNFSNPPSSCPLSRSSLPISGSFPGSEGDYCIVREAKKIAIGSARLKAIHAMRAKIKSAAAAGGEKKAADKKGAAAAKTAKK